MLIEQIDDLDPEALERSLDGLLDMLGLTVQPRRARPCVAAAQIEAEFGGDDQLFAERSESVSHQVLVRVGAIDFGGIEERDAAFDGGAEKRGHLLLVLGRTIRKAHAHAAEAERRYFQITVSEFTLLHRGLLLCGNSHRDNRMEHFLEIEHIPSCALKEIFIMYHDQLNGLLALKTVAETRNFTAAAKTLGISPSAVSQAIKQLEQRLGVALLSRTTRSTSLTEAGEGFLNHAGPALDQVLVALENVGSYAEKPSGLLRLNLPRQVYPLYAAPLVASFIRKHPDITVELFFEDEASDVVEKGFDAGIRLSDILAKDVVALKLFGPVRFVTAASPEYFDKMGRPKHPEDLLSHNCIRPRLGG